MIESISLPCPWCTAKQVEANPYLNSVNYRMWRAKCKNCGATGPSKNDAEEALMAWDRRKIEIPDQVTIYKESSRCDELVPLALRMWEMNQNCLCVDGMKCVPCRLRAILTEMKAKGS